MNSRSDTLSIGRFELLIGACLLVLAATVWRTVPSERSFWLDEFLTYWAIKDGASEAVSRSLQYQGQSPLFFVLMAWWSAVVTATNSLWSSFATQEALLRFPSVLASLVSCCFVYLLAREYFDRRTAYAAVVLFCAAPFTPQSLSFRPYSLAMMCATGSTWLLLQLFKEQRVRLYSVLYVMLTVGAILFHYLFAGILAVHALFLIFNRTALSVQRQRLVAVLMLISAAVLPLGYLHLRHLAQNHRPLFFAAVPSLQDLGEFILPAVMFRPLCLGWLTGFLLMVGNGGVASIQIDRAKWMPLVCWAILPPCIFFLVSTYGEHSIFVHRYMSWYVPASVIILASGFAFFRPRWIQSAAILTMMFFLYVDISARLWSGEPWREAISSVNSKISDPDTPVLLYSGLVELQDSQLLLAPEAREYLTAPATLYPLQGTVLAIPSNFYGSGRAGYFKHSVEPLLLQSKEFFLIASMVFLPSTNRGESVPLYIERLVGKWGFEAEPLLTGGQVWAVRFKRQ
ncbi:MAG: glycosyltransferase family 39 protein [Deltaproteobacteria bacterium]|nr:glycosyltransferase family 39 protein [Deltaproteobacteria bacterium]